MCIVYLCTVKDASDSESQLSAASTAKEQRRPDPTKHPPTRPTSTSNINSTYVPSVYSREILLAIRQGSGSSKSPIRRTGLQARKSVSRKLVRLTSNLTKPNQEESYSPTLSLTKGTGQTALRHRRLALHMVAPCGDATNKFTHKSASPKRDVI